MKPLSIFILALLWPLWMIAQNNGTPPLSGRVLDENLHTAIAGVSVYLILAKDSSKTPYTAVTDEKGHFELITIKSGIYKLYLSCMGYQAILLPNPITVDNDVIRLADVYLKKKSLELFQVEIIESRPPVSLKKDTTEFSAGYYKTKETAVMGDLLRKLPGVEIAPDGSITIDGISVKQILVDGRPYFGNDSKIALKNILSGMVDRVQLIDRKPSAEDTRPTGSNSPEKAINITLKKDHYKILNGLVSGGYGTDQRYSFRTTLNRFTPQQQLSFIGSADNINGFEENLGGINGNGETSSWNVGLNYNQDINPKLSLSVSYMANNEQSAVLTTSFRQTFLKDSSFNYHQSSTTKNLSTRHVTDLNMKFLIDSSSSIAVINRLFYTIKTGNFENEFSTNDVNQTPVNIGKTDNQTSNRQLFYLTNWTYTKKFHKTGQILIAGFNYSHGQTPEKIFNHSQSLFRQPGGDQFQDSLNQLNDKNGTNVIFQVTANYAQPIFKDHFLDLVWIYSAFNNKTKKNVYSSNSPKGPYELLVDSLSADFQSTTLANYGGLSFRAQKPKYDYSIGLGIINNELTTSIINRKSLRKNLVNIFPTASFNYTIKNSMRLHFDYSRNIQPPDPNQLQPVPDNSNPLFLQKGNPDLKPTVQNYFNLGIRSFNSRSLLNLTFNTTAGFSSNQVINELFIDSFGKQTSRPINLNGAYYVSLYGSISIPIKGLKTALNTSTMLNLNRDYSISNNVQTQINKTALRENIAFNYTHKEIFDLMTSLTVTYSTTKYSQQNNNYHYLDYVFSLNGNVNLPWSLTLGTNINYTLATGRAKGYNMDMLLIGGKIEKTLMPSKRAQLKLQAFDLLNRNMSKLRNVGENYIEDIASNPLKQFILLSFTYFFK